MIQHTSIDLHQSAQSRVSKKLQKYTVSLSSGPVYEVREVGTARLLGVSTPAAGAVVDVLLARRMRKLESWIIRTVYE